MELTIFELVVLKVGWASEATGAYASMPWYSSAVDRLTSLGLFKAKRKDGITDWKITEKGTEYLKEIELCSK